MAAVMITDQPAPSPRHDTGTGPRRPRLVAVPDPAPRVRTARVSAATFRRRRLGALVGVAAVVFMAGRAGAALGATPRRSRARSVGPRHRPQRRRAVVGGRTTPADADRG
jgi:hypothetical protein